MLKLSIIFYKPTEFPWFFISFLVMFQNKAKSSTLPSTTITEFQVVVVFDIERFLLLRFSRILACFFFFHEYQLCCHLISRFHWIGWHFASTSCGKSVAMVITSIQLNRCRLQYSLWSAFEWIFVPLADASYENIRKLCSVVFAGKPSLRISLYVLFSHFRPRDVLMGIFLFSFHKLCVHLHVHMTIP